MRVRHKLFNFLFMEILMTVEAKLDTLIAGQTAILAAIAAAPAADNTAVLAAIAADSAKLDAIAAVIGTEPAPAPAV